MNYRKGFSLNSAVVCVVCVLVLGSVAHAGPPLICHPFDIGNAKSLPFQGPEWSATQSGYDVNRLVDDTLALLQPGTPVIVRMETMRRATLYGRDHREIADALLQRLKARVAALKDPERRDAEAVMAQFDLGYLVETYRQAALASQGTSNAFWRFKQADPTDVDGYALVKKAMTRGDSPEMEFAAAVITADRRDKSYQEHLQKAFAGAKEGTLLARNLETHFGSEARAFHGKAIAEKR
jgi:hypothetical protein